MADPARLAAALKALPLRLIATRPIDEAISTAGGVAFEALDGQLMMRTVPACSAPARCWTGKPLPGGYLLTACFASGRAAGTGALAWLDSQGRRNANSPMET